MIDFNISRKNMILNQLKVNNITEENILKAIESIPREIFLPSHLKSRAYLDEDTEIFANRFLLEPKILGYILKLSKIQITDVVLDLAHDHEYEHNHDFYGNRSLTKSRVSKIFDFFSFGQRLVS